MRTLLLALGIMSYKKPFCPKVFFTTTLSQKKINSLRSYQILNTSNLWLNSYKLAFEDRKISLEALSSIDAMIDSVDKYMADASDPQKKTIWHIKFSRGWYENNPSENFFV